MKKSYVVFHVIVVLAFTVAGCGETSSNSTPRKTKVASKYDMGCVNIAGKFTTDEGYEYVLRSWMTRCENSDVICYSSSHGLSYTTKPAQ